MQRNVTAQSKQHSKAARAYPQTEGRIRFVEAPAGFLSAIWVSAQLHASQLHGVYRALHRTGIQVTQIHLERRNQSITYILDVAEFDGSRIGLKRWLSVQPIMVQCVLSLTAKTLPS